MLTEYNHNGRTYAHPPSQVSWFIQAPRLQSYIVRGRRVFKVAVMLIVFAVASCAWIDHRDDSKLAHKNTNTSPVEIKQEDGSQIVYVPPVETREPETNKQESPAFTSIGSGNFLRKLRSTQQSVEEGDQGYTLNFENIDVRELIGSVFGTTLKYNYAIDPSVQGNITVRTGSPIPASKLLSHMEDILLLHNIAIVKDGDFLKFVPTGNVPKNRLADSDSAGTAAIGQNIEIIPIRYVDVEKMVDLLRPFAKDSSIVSFDQQRNFISISGSKLERDHLLEIIKIFDVNMLAGMSFELISLVSATPETIENELNTIMGTGAENLMPGVRFVALSRLKSILVISRSPQGLIEARTWIKKLDFGTDPEKVRLYVYKVQNVEAAGLAEVLSGLLGVDITAKSSSDTELIAPTLKPASITSEPVSKEPTEPLSTSLQNQSVIQGSTKKSGEVSILGGDTKTRIVADEGTNSLFIRTTPRQYDEIHAMLKLVDIVPLQVMIEATIAEVTLNDKLNYGVEWFFQSGKSDVTFSTDTTGAILSNFPGFSFFYGTNNVAAVINALDSVTDVNILSSPQLLVLDNHEAFLQIGDQVPVATQSVVDTTNPAAPIVNSIEFRDTGIVLKVTPRVNFNGLVNLDIQQEVSDVIPTTTSGIDSPTIQQRLINSSIVVQSGKTIALGGLIRDKVSDEQTGIPVLSSIPLLGSLFGATKESHSRTELLVLITPRVVRNQTEAGDLTRELRRKIKAFSAPEVE